LQSGRKQPDNTAFICNSTERIEEKNKHRGVGNLFDVKLKAIENLASVGIKVTLVTTIVNTVKQRRNRRHRENLPRRILIKFRRLLFNPFHFTDATKMFRQRPYSATLHARGNDARFEKSIGRNAATVARLVSAFELFGIYVGNGYAARRGRAVGLVVVQLSSELRDFYVDCRQ
jgi:hypothetical protein